ncbi:MAG: RNA polymerase factor sigma-54 [Spirochaetota bacterium]
MQFQKPGLHQEQKLKMNPQLYQSIQLMALPVQDLKLRIQQELEANPALQMNDDRTTVSLEEVEPEPGEREEYDYYTGYSEETSYRTSGSYDQEGADAKQGFMEGALSRPESLHDHLLWQLRLQPITPEEFEVGELLIWNVDENGFHREPVEQVIPADKRHLLEAMLRLVQTFEPQGTCVSDYRESLLVQTRLAEDPPPLAEVLLEHHFELLEKRTPAELARKVKSEESEVERALAFIRDLTPFPGRSYSNDTPTYVTPDLLIRRREGRFVIVLNDEEIPELSVDPFFQELRDSDREVRQFVSTRVRDARWFINSIQQRNRTMLKVARAILDFQRDFFLRGPKHLVPLTLRDIAGDVGVHEATVSRITNGKYMETEWGIFELKHFFSNAVAGTGTAGSRYSKEGVKEVIREIFAEESGDQHLSDQKISELLEKRGIKLARRTVAKYRKELAISSSYDR